MGKGRESADDMGEIVLVFWCKVLDHGDTEGPESEEGDDGHETVVERGHRVEGRIRTSLRDCHCQHRRGEVEGLKSLKGDRWQSVVLRNRGIMQALIKGY